MISGKVGSVDKKEKVVIDADDESGYRAFAEQNVTMRNMQQQ